MLKKTWIIFLLMALITSGTTSLQAVSKKEKKTVHTQINIFTPGTDDFLDYSKYGEFENLGTDKYKYTIKDSAGLKQASGEGIFPNITDIYKSPDFKKLKREKKLEGDKWAFVNTLDSQANYYKWATAQEEPGVKQYYTALALEQAGDYKRAVKAYHAITVFFPKSTGVTFWKTPWYVAPVAIEKIKYLTREHKELGVKLVDADIDIIGKYDDEKSNDVFIINPGKIVPATAEDWILKKADLESIGVKKVIGKEKVKLVEYNNKHFQLMVDDKPYIMRAIAYSPTPVGLSPDNGSVNVSKDWSWMDYNKNKIIDGPYEAWVDENKNNKKDRKEKVIGDFQLMKDMGINTIRIYNFPELNKEVLKDGYEKYNFMYMIGNFLGMYGFHSGAEWFEGTDYTNPKHRENMLNSVREMVEEYKNEPYVLMWVLGNENNYGTVGVPGVSAGTSCNVRKDPAAYYKFINECAKLIKELDPQQRPVAICNGDLLFMDICAQNAPDLDIYGANAYRGKEGFGTLWRDVLKLYGKPVIITEYGCPAYSKYITFENNETEQAEYHRGSWLSMEENFAGYGSGNALGGVIFEWTDEWWKAGPPPEFDQHKQDIIGQWMGPFIDGWSYEEWFGLCSIGDGKHGPFKRQLRKSYFTYKELWEKYRK
jgi:tetratricopeptide (TPR) repeat protein